MLCCERIFRLRSAGPFSSVIGGVPTPTIADTCHTPRLQMRVCARVRRMTDHQNSAINSPKVDVGWLQVEGRFPLGNGFHNQLLTGSVGVQLTRRRCATMCEPYTPLRPPSEIFSGFFESADFHRVPDHELMSKNRV